MAAKCRSCGQRIIWAVTEATEKRPAKRIPLDADPERPGKALVVEGGNLVFTGQRDTEGSWIVRYIKNGRHRTHFASCSHAASHRKVKA